MAGSYSLGLYEPSALAYMVSEGLLPPNPCSSSYQWKFQQSLEETPNVTDEIFQASTCVVWSRGGLVKRVFNLDIEGETIIHAFTTCFESHPNISEPQYSNGSDKTSLQRERALVVILKTQAHIFLLSGGTHIIPLSFEVHKAIPAAHGFFLQRKVTQKGTNDFTVSNDNKSPVKNLQSSKLDQSDAPHQSKVSILIQNAAGRQSLSKLPSTFAFNELLSELSLVVSGSLRKHDSTDNWSALTSDEEILYVSTDNELYELHVTNSEPVYLAITGNVKTKSLTLWRVVFQRLDSGDVSRKPRIGLAGRTSKRKSSNVHGRQTGVATPTPRGPGTFRESIGGLGQSLAESSVFPLGRENPPASTVDLATQLGHEFEQIGVQTRSARRVSSMLARTDLGGANDRSAFNEMALGAFGRKSLGRSMRRGESLGGFSDRQSFGTRRRSSFQAASSVYSDGTSFLDIPASHLLDEAASHSGMDSVDEPMDLSQNSTLPRNVAFMKLKSLPYEFSDHSCDVHTSFKIITMLAPDRSTADDRRSRVISVCIMDNSKREMTIVNVAAKVGLSTNRDRGDRIMYDLKAVEVQRGQSIVDACSIVEDQVKRLLILTQTREGRSALHLEAPWSISYGVDLPTQFRVIDKSTSIRRDSQASRREIGINRIIPHSEIQIKGLRRCEFSNQVLALDDMDRYHRLSFRMTPQRSIVRKILQLCNFVLPPEFYDSLLVAWWETKRWIQLQGSEPDIEWTAMVVTLFVLAVPFIGTLQSHPAQGSRRKKGGLLRSTSGTSADLSQWDLIQEIENCHSSQLRAASTPWEWLGTTTQPKSVTKSPRKHSRTASIEPTDDAIANPFLIRCVNLARDFLQSPAGENATGPEGYLPTAVNKDRAYRRTALASILVGLHLLREEFKLHEVASSLPSESSDELAYIIAQLASWMKWKDWRLEPGRYYYTEISRPDRCVIEESSIDNLEIPAQPFEPPSIFQHVEQFITMQKTDSFPSLLDLISQTRPITRSHPLWKEAALITPRLFAMVDFLAQIKQKKKHRSIVKHMLNCGIDGQVLDTLPSGIAAVFQQAIAQARGEPAAEWPTAVKSLLGRSDLDDEVKSRYLANSLTHISYVHDAVRDTRSISNNAVDADSISRWDASLELDRQAITRLIFHEDRRFQEASKLVNQTRPPVVEFTSETGWSEANMLEAQKELAVHVTRRTLSVAAGRAMMHFNARAPLLTERVPIPAFSLQCVMKSRDVGDSTQPMTLSADKALFTEDKVCWAFFHNGASAGLMISRETKWIDTSWILYNKPPELTNRHAGFLLALGLNGHLKSLAKWVAFKYLTPKHTMTSIGLLLGLAASYIGTMDTLVARLLSVHVTRLLPIGAAELNLSPLTQTTGIMGVGLLYYNSQHRRMSEIMLSEIENNDSEDRSGDEPILRDEGHRLAAGFSLGLINLGRGKNLQSLHDTGVVERLLSIAVGTKNVNLVHVLDRATAGAVIAIGFIFLKTNDITIAQKIDIPDTMHQFDYVRPDVFLLRTLAKHLIMWDSIKSTKEFVRTSLPPVFQKRVDLSTTKRLSTDDLPFFNVLAGICFAISLRFAGSHRHDARDLLVAYLDQFLRLTRLPALNYDAKVTLNGLRNCLDVLALSCATVMSGSGDVVVMRRLRALHGRTDKETPFGSHLAAHMALGVLFLSGGTATFGTSDLAVAALVISLYPIFPVDVLDNKGHLQALRHLWVLAVENRCLVLRDVESHHVISDIEAEVVLIDNTIQRLRSPGLLPAFEVVKRISFKHENYWPVEINFDAPAKSGLENQPHQHLDPTSTITNRDYYKRQGAGLKIFLQRRSAYEKPDADMFSSELQALNEARGVPSTDPNAGVNEKWRQTQGHGASSHDAVQNTNLLDWVFTLDSLKHLDFAEKALLRDSGSTTGRGTKLLDGTAIDSRLEFEFGCLGMASNDKDDDGDEIRNKQKLLPSKTLNKDKLWQIRLLFAWADRWEKEEEEDQSSNDKGPHSQNVKGSARWMKKEVIEQLRWKVWKMAGAEDS